MNQRNKNLEGTLDSDKSKEKNKQGNVQEIEGVLVGRSDDDKYDGNISLTVKQDDSSIIVVKYSYENRQAAELMYDALPKNGDARRVRLKIGNVLSDSEDYYQGLGPVRVVQPPKKEKKEKNETQGKPIFDIEHRIQTGKLEAVKTLNKLLEDHLFPHGITCLPCRYDNSYRYIMNHYQYVNSPYSVANERSISLAINTGIIFNNIIQIGKIYGLDDKLETNICGNIFDDQGLHNISISTAHLKEVAFTPRQYESKILNPLRNFAQAYEKVSSRKAFMSVHF
ncbi:hypothetical protein COU56_03775 [Candidatus Pacearchaeota archaeon CG10_big_fil_rev_8_21_14_0_10_31_9]|nr:MAG: hypothetical protein COU56_03775 [Candidatus Pacearchaeota archaeon CG10_big_fil_rev_8_21_14_0_10_31_9]PIZ83223.1 MAG: hypothetical protein COX97_01450 [Candidatus Pacearchaeota archaeon CG_4_10_14_0_2_um_filter_05_32_18]